MVRASESTLEQRRAFLQAIFARRGMASLSDRIEAAVAAFDDAPARGGAESVPPTRLRYPVADAPSKLAV
jgi:cytochrome P450